MSEKFDFAQLAAREFLREQLALWPVRIKDLEEEARQRGITPTTLGRVPINGPVGLNARSCRARRSRLRL
jgi:hypothetical protein